MSRTAIPMRVQLAAALLQISGMDGQSAIPHAHAQAMTADQIISLFHRDHHPIPKSEGGPDEPWNITWRYIGAHRHKTAKIDIPRIAKTKRLARAAAEAQSRLLAKAPGQSVRPKSKWAKGRKMQSRGFQKRRA